MSDFLHLIPTQYNLPEMTILLSPEGFYPDSLGQQLLDLLLDNHPHLWLVNIDEPIGDAIVQLLLSGNPHRLLEKEPLVDADDVPVISLADFTSKLRSLTLEVFGQEFFAKLAAKRLKDDPIAPQYVVPTKTYEEAGVFVRIFGRANCLVIFLGSSDVNQSLPHYIRPTSMAEALAQLDHLYGVSAHDK